MDADTLAQSGSEGVGVGGREEVVEGIYLD